MGPILSRRAGTYAVIGAGLFAIVAFAGPSGLASISHPQTDLAVYIAGARALLHGNDLYSLRAPGNGLPFTYPIFSAVTFVPLAALSAGAARIALRLVSLVSLLAVVYSSLRSSGLSQRSAVALCGAAGAVALFVEPVTTTFGLGQVNLLVVALVIVDVLLLRGRRGNGVLVGLATGIKLTPGVFIVYFAVTRQWRAAAVSMASLAATMALGFVVQPQQAWLYWTALISDADRVGGVAYVSNQSFLGVLSRLFRQEHPPQLLVSGLGLVTLVVALWAAARLDRGGYRLEAASVVGFGALLASPISWSHHWIWAIPGGVVLVHRALAAWRRKDRPWSLLWWVVAASWTGLFVWGPMWHTPREHLREFHHTPVQALMAASYGIAGVLFVGVTALWAARRGSAAPSPAGGASRSSSPVGAASGR